MIYRSISQLADQVLSWSSRLPRDIDLIVGIPRSGLLPANLLALYRNLPLTDVEGLLEGRILSAGRRLQNGSATPRTLENGKLKILVVDDSVWSGSAIRTIKERIGSAGLHHEISYGAVYVRAGYERTVDFHCESLEGVRVFEWNFLHHENLVKACMDIDGVLCRDPSTAENDDGARYLEFLQKTGPMHIPGAKVGWLVTSRLEKYRAATEAWLEAHGVEYGELIMMSFEDMQARRAANCHGAFKAETYKRTGAALFVESSLSQSVQIANWALKPVLCVDTMQMVYPGLDPRSRQAHEPSQRLRRSVASLRRRAAKGIMALRGQLA